MARKFKRYTLEQKKSYHKKVATTNEELMNDGKPYSKTNLDYSIGFCSGVYWGLPKPENFNKYSRPKQLGILAGVRARVKNKTNKGSKYE